jgi:hypothetical protein
MNFFEAQDQARKNTRWLILSSFLAVIAIVAAVYGVVVIVSWYASTDAWTRPPEWWNPRLFGIAGALKKIAGLSGSLLNHPQAEQASHLFFGAGIRSRFALFATHPPIEERIRRLDPSFRGQAPAALGFTAPEPALGLATGILPIVPGKVARSIGTVDAEHLGYARSLLQRLPEPLRGAVRQAQEARRLVFALALVGAEDPASIWREASGDTAEWPQVASYLTLIGALGRDSWLPLLELSIPALQELPQQELHLLPERVDRLTRADGLLNVFEFALLAALRHTLEQRSSGKERPVGTLREVRTDIHLLLSFLSHVGHRDESSALRAFTAATALAPRDGAWHPLRKDELSLTKLEPALARLRHTNFRFTAKLIEACVAAITHDGEVTLTEAELLRAIGACLDCPVPPPCCLQAAEAEFSRRPNPLFRLSGATISVAALPAFTVLTNSRALFTIRMAYPMPAKKEPPHAHPYPPFSGNRRALPDIWSHRPSA